MVEESWLKRCLCWNQCLEKKSRARTANLEKPARRPVLSCQSSFTTPKLRRPFAATGYRTPLLQRGGASKEKQSFVLRNAGRHRDVGARPRWPYV